DLGRLHVALQCAEGSVPEIHDEPVTLGLDEIAGGWRVRAGHAAGTTEHGELHATPPNAGVAMTPTSGPRKRWLSRWNGSTGPVAAKTCCGGGASSERSRSASVRTR